MISRLAFKLLNLQVHQSRHTQARIIRIRIREYMITIFNDFTLSNTTSHHQLSSEAKGKQKEQPEPEADPSKPICAICKKVFSKIDKLRDHYTGVLGHLKHPDMLTHLGNTFKPTAATDKARKVADNIRNKALEKAKEKLAKKM
jgi:hypothetical protein